MTDQRLSCESPNCTLTFGPNAHKQRAKHQNEAHPELYTIHCSQPGCKKKFRKDADYQAHLLGSHRGKNISCDSCPEMFKTNRDLKRHKDRIHNPETGLSHYCPVFSCDKAYSTPEQVPIHVRAFHADAYPFPCPVITCTSAFKYAQDHRQHVKVHHQGKRDCSVCGVTFDNYENLNGHVREKHASRFPYGCSDCNGMFESEELLTEHTIKTHKFEYPCRLCPSKFPGVPEFNLHIEARHAAVLPFACMSCNLVFKTDAEIQAHFTPNHEMQCIEPDCDEVAANAEELEEHYSEKHKDVLQFACKDPTCSVAFPSKKLRAIHRGREDVHSEYQQCSHIGCSHKFDNVNLLRQHESEHSRVVTSPFMCNGSACTERFDSLHAMFEHEMTTHIRSRCEICSLTFENGINALAHCVTAHDNKIRCTSCSTVFTGLTAMSEYKRHAQQFDLDVVENVIAVRQVAGEATIVHLGVMSAEVNKFSTDYEQPVVVECDHFWDALDEVEFEPLDSDSPQASSGLTAPGPSRQRGFIEDFHSARLAAQEGAETIVGDVNRALHTFVAGSGCRTLEAAVRQDSTGNNVGIVVTEKSPATQYRVPQTFRIEFPILPFTLSKTAVSKLVTAIKDVLERCPCPLSHLTRRESSWVFSAAQRLFLARNPEQRLPIQEPRLGWQAGSGGLSYITYKHTMYGYDLRNQATWKLEANLNFEVNRIIERSQLPIVLPYIVWTDTHAAHEGLPKDGLPKELVDRVQTVARHLASTCMGWIGSRQEFSFYVTLLKASLLAEDFKHAVSQYHAVAEQWTTRELRTGLRLCRMSRLAFQDRVVIMPSDETSQYLKLTSLVARVEHAWAVQDKILSGIKSGLSIVQIWRQACRELDRQRDLLVEGTQEPITVCSQLHEHEYEDLHVCPICFKLRMCKEFTDEVQIVLFLICKSCAANTLKVQAAMPMDPADYTRCFLERNLKRLLLIEVENVQIAISSDSLQDEQKAIMASLDCYIQPDGAVLDNFLTLKLNSDIEAYKTHSGPRRHPLRATIDACHPVVRGIDEQPRYHTVGNISPMAFSANIGIGHYPKIYLYAIHLMAKDSAQAYEQGLALLRVCHANSYEMSTASAVQQSKRLSIAIDRRFDRIQESLRTAKPLPRTVPSKMVLRTSIRSDKIQDDTSFKFEHQDYVYEEITRVAHQYGLYFNDQILWKRNGVFFPYAFDSEVPDWSNERLWHKIHEEQKRMRDVCDRRSKNMANRPEFGKQELIIVLAHLWMSAVRRDLDKGLPPRMCGRDQMGLIPHPTIRMPLSGSIGHDNHHLAMVSGLTGYDALNQTQCRWNPEECNILWETQFCNRSKWDFDESYYPQIFAIPSSVRIGNYVDGSPKSVHLPGQIPKFPLYSLLDTKSVVELKQSNYVDDADLELLVDYYAYEGDEFEDGKFIDLDNEDEDIEDMQELEDDASLIAENDSVQLESTVQAIRKSDNTTSSITKPQSKNMGRLDATCYISAPLQLLLALPEIRHLLRSSVSTSQSSVHVLLDPDNTFMNIAHLRSLHKAISTLSDHLIGAGYRLPKQLTQDLLQASSALNSQFHDTASDAGEYYTFLLERLNHMYDITKLSNAQQFAKSSPSTALAMFKVELLKRSIRGLPQQVLRDDIAEYLRCHLDSGYNSSIAKDHLLHLVREYECRHCHTMMREFYHTWTLMVKHSDSSSVLGPFSMNSVKDDFLDEQAKQKFESRCANSSCNVDKDTFDPPVVRIINAPRFLAIMTNRVGYINEPGGAKFTLNTDRWTDSNVIDLASWKMNLAMPSESTPGEDFILRGITRYRRVGLLAFKDDFDHWVGFARQGDRNDQDWVEFDDLEEYPKFQDPDVITDTGFCEGMILYRREDGTTDDEHNLVSAENLPQTQLIPAVAKTSIVKPIEMSGATTPNKSSSLSKPTPALPAGSPLLDIPGRTPGSTPRLMPSQSTTSVSQLPNQLDTVLQAMKDMSSHDLRAVRKFASRRLDALTTENEYWEGVYDDDVEPRSYNRSITGGFKQFHDRYLQSLDARTLQSPSSASSAGTKRDISQLYGQDQPGEVGAGSDRPLKQRSSIKAAADDTAALVAESSFTIMSGSQFDDSQPSPSKQQQSISASRLRDPSPPRSPLSRSVTTSNTADDSEEQISTIIQPGPVPAQTTTPDPAEPLQKSMTIPHTKAIRERFVNKSIPRHMLPTASSLGKRSGALTSAVLGGGSGNGTGEAIARGIAGVKRAKLHGTEALKSAFKVPFKKNKDDDKGEKKNKQGDKGGKKK